MKELFIEINNQCASVQSSIAKHYENPHSKVLVAELEQLHALIEALLTTLPKT